MKQYYKAEKIGDGTLSIISAYTIEVVCKVCGFDLAKTDLNANNCPNCEVSLELRQNITVEATPLSMSGATLE
jgi:rubrerythrin